MYKVKDMEKGLEWPGGQNIDTLYIPMLSSFLCAYRVFELLSF